MASVSIHPPKTPVTKGSHGVSKATIPNVCKMPGPPAPFIPSPLPNIGKSELSPQGYSTTVEIEGNAVAIRGATFESMGDLASKATGGGLISANTHGPTKFITPGSLSVKIEGKNVHLLGEPMLNNCGPGGSPPNTGATMAGVKQVELTVDEAKALLCALLCECKAEAQAKKFETSVDPDAFDSPLENFGVEKGLKPGKAANQACVERKFNKEYKKTNLKAEQSYDMKTDPPSPVPGRPRGTKRPDFVRLRGPGPARAPNIDVFEMKFPPDCPGDKEEDEYRKIGGGDEPIILDPETCGC